MAAPECEREARKRRERRDSGCAHERKERRPHSEERPPPPPPPPPLHDYNQLESERRAERLSRARRPQYGGKRRRAPVRAPKQPKENEYCITTEDIRCASPICYNYAALPKPQVCEEPELLDSNSVYLAAEREQAERARRDERSAALVSARRDQPSPDRRLEKIIKKIQILKKNITNYEKDFESENGHSISLSDRITDIQLTRMYENLRKLQAEKKCIKADPVEYAMKVQAAKQQKERDDKLDKALNSDKNMSETVLDIEEWLEGCRAAAGRAGGGEAGWSAAQLQAEKLCVQRVLLRLEAARGRPPAHSAERGAARHLYERYRAVKRALANARPDVVSGATIELATIHEHEPMLFPSVDSSSDSQEKPSDSLQSQVSGATIELATIHEHEPMLFPLVDSSSKSQEKPSDSLQSQETTDTPVQSPPQRESSLLEEATSTSSAPSLSASEEAPSDEAPGEQAPTEGLHCLPLDALARHLADAKLQKAILRRSIKEYEVTFEMQNGRKVQKDDKKGREDDYLRYKAIRARIKLLNALINKQKTSAKSA